MGSLIILGASTRAAAQSAIRAGYDPWCIDLFADLDLRAIAPVMRCPSDAFPNALLEMAREHAPRDARLLFTGAMENHSWLVSQLGMQWPMLTPPATSIKEVRDPWSDKWHDLAQQHIPGIRLPYVRSGVSRTRARTENPTPTRADRWLIKPLDGASGRGIRRARWWLRTGDHEYVQQFVEGVPASAIVHASTQRTQVVGVTRQLVGERAFGAGRFTYCGSIADIQLSNRQRDALDALACRLAESFNLRGLFGIDLVIDPADRLWPVEVNPRYTASVEIVERSAHVAALHEDRSHLTRPVGDSGLARTGQVFGKAIVFVKRDTQVTDLYDQFAPHEIADVPDPGELFQRGQPICTVFAAAESGSACLDRLRGMADRLYTRLP